MAEPLLEIELAEYLKSQGFGNLWNEFSPKIFVGEEPQKDPAPDDTITIIEDGGGPPNHVIAETRSFRVRVRGKDWDDTKTTAQQVARALHWKEGILSSIQVARVRADGNPTPLGRDPDRRYVWTQNFTALTKRIEP